MYLDNSDKQLSYTKLGLLDFALWIIVIMLLPFSSDSNAFAFGITMFTTMVWLLLLAACWPYSVSLSRIYPDGKKTKFPLISYGVISIIVCTHILIYSDPGFAFVALVICAGRICIPQLLK